MAPMSSNSSDEGTTMQRGPGAPFVYTRESASVPYCALYGRVTLSRWPFEAGKDQKRPDSLRSVRFGATNENPSNLRNLKCMPLIYASQYMVSEYRRVELAARRSRRARSRAVHPLTLYTTHM